MADLRALLERVRRTQAAEEEATEHTWEARHTLANDAREELCTALLASPSVLDAYEAVLRLGVARAAKRAAQDANYAAADAYYDARSAGTGDLAALLAESLRAGRAVVPAWDAWDEANSTMRELADRLAKGTDR